jgi:hypothetical protein
VREAWEELSLAHCGQYVSHFQPFRSQGDCYRLDIGHACSSREKLLGELFIHPGAIQFYSERSAKVAVYKEFVPFSVPVLQLLECFPLILIIADQLGCCHDGIPIVIDTDLCYLYFLQEVQDLDSSMLTILMILTPTFLKVTAEKVIGTDRMTSAACSSLKRFSMMRLCP